MNNVDENENMSSFTSTRRSKSPMEYNLRTRTKSKTDPLELKDK